MYMEDVKNQLFSTPLLRVLDFLLQNSDLELNDSEIAGKITGAKRAAVHQSLVRLERMGIIKRSRRGRRCFNSVVFEQVWLTQFKITSNILVLMPLVEEIKKHSSKIVLFGSCAGGTNRHDSDIDLLVVNSEPEIIRRAVADFGLSDEIQLISKTPVEMLELESNEPVFVKQIREGVVLWEK